MPRPKKFAGESASRTLTEEGRRQVAVTLTTTAFQIIAETRAATGETRSQFVMRLILSDAARKEGQQAGSDEMRARMTELLATG